MVASPYEMLDDLVSDWEKLQQAQDNGLREQAEVLQNSVGRLFDELKEMGFQREVHQVLERTEHLSDLEIGAIDEFS